jgi:hypothetical protein
MGKFIITEEEKNKIRKMHGLINEQDDNDKFYERHVSNVLKDGYKEVSKISLPDGEYKKQGSGYQVNLYDKDGQTFTGYVIITNSGIRGAWNNQPENVTNGTIQDAYKILFKDSGYKGPTAGSNQGQEQPKPIANYTTSNFQKLAQEIIDAPGPKTNVSGGKGSFTLKNGNNYTYDFSNVTDYSNKSKTYFISEKSENNAFGVQDIKPNTIWVGFLDQMTSTATIIYVNNKNKVVSVADKTKTPQQ